MLQQLGRRYDNAKYTVCSVSMIVSKYLRTVDCDGGSVRTLRHDNVIQNEAEIYSVGDFKT